MGLRNPAPPGDHEEVCGFLRQRIAEMEALPWDELGRYGHRTEAFRARSGSTYRVVSVARREVAGRINIEIWAWAEKGWRRWAPYFESGSRWGPERS